MSEKEIDRYRRIRDQQIHARDPSKKQLQLDHTISQKHKRRIQKFSLVTMLDEIPARWIGLVMGLLITVALLLILPEFIEADWGDLLAIGIGVFLMLLFFLVGRVMDMKDTLRDLIN